MAEVGVGPTRPGERIDPRTGQGVMPGGSPAQSASVGGDLADLANSLGIDWGGGFDTAPEELPVWMGSTRRTGMARTRGTTQSRVVPLSEAYAEFYAWTDAQLQKFQEEAYARGYYGNVDREDVPFGEYDEDTLSIWTKMVDRSAGFYSQGKRVSPMKALTMSAGRTPTGDESDGPAPLVTVLSNPDDVAKVFKAGVRTVLGKKVSQAEVDKFVAAYRSQEAALQQQSYNMEVNETGGTVTEMASAQVQAEIAAREIDPTKADSRKVVSQFDSLVKMLGEGGIMQTGAGQ